MPQIGEQYTGLIDFFEPFNKIHVLAPILFSFFICSDKRQSI